MADPIRTVVLIKDATMIMAVDAMKYLAALRCLGSRCDK
jgi:hypothetical protein